MTHLSLYCYKQGFASLLSISFPPTILQSDVKLSFSAMGGGNRKNQHQKAQQFCIQAKSLCNIAAYEFQIQMYPSAPPSRSMVYTSLSPRGTPKIALVRETLWPKMQLTLGSSYSFQTFGSISALCIAVHSASTIYMST